VSTTVNTLDFQISSIDRLAWLKVGTGTIRRNLNRRSQFSGELEDIGRGYTPVVGSPIVIGQIDVGISGTLVGEPPLVGAFLPGGTEGQQLATRKIFAGLITEIDSSCHAKTDKLRHRVTAKDYSQIADRRRTNKDTYTGQTLKAIVEDIVTNYMDGEGIDTTNVATGPTISEEVKFDYQRVSDAFNRLSQMTGYFWYIDPDKFLYFDQFSSNPAPFNLTYPSDDYGDLHRISTIKDYRNRQHVRTDHEITVGVNLVTRNDTGEQTARAAVEDGSGIHEAVSENRGVRTAATLNSIGDGLLRQFGEVPDKLTFKTRRSGLEPGHRITITDSRFGISAVEYLIEQIEYSIPTKVVVDWIEHRVSVTSVEPYGRAASTFFERVADLVAIPEPVAEVVDESTEVESTYLLQQTLSAASTAISDGVTTPQNRDMLTVELTQDGSGDREITWGTEFDSSTITNIDTRASKVTRFFFVYMSSKWRLVGAPVTS